MTGRSSLKGAVVLGGTYGALAVARSLGRRGVPVACVGEPRSIALTSRYITHSLAWLGTAEPDPVGKLLRFSQEHKLEGWVILPCADFEVQLIAKNYAALAQHFALVTMDWTALEPLNDKSALYALADRLGLGYPQVYPAGTAADEITYPVALKPVSTEASNPLTRAKGWLAVNAADFTTKLALAESYAGRAGVVVQQLIPGDGDVQLSYAALWDHGQELCSLTASRSRQFPLGFGTSPFVETIEVPQVQAEARRLLAAVGYHGLVEVEFKRDHRDGGLKLLDVNTRVWAWIGLGQAAGIDFPYLAALIAAGEKLPVLEPPRYGPAWRRSIPNALSVLQSVMQRGKPGYAAWRSLFGHAHSAVFSRDDPGPFFAEIPVQLMRKLGPVLRR